MGTQNFIQVRILIMAGLVSLSFGACATKQSQTGYNQAGYNGYSTNTPRTRALQAQSANGQALNARKWGHHSAFENSQRCGSTCQAGGHHTQQTHTASPSPYYSGTVSTPAPIVSPRAYTPTPQVNCPTGTTKQANGSCLQPSSNRISRTPVRAHTGYNTGGYSHNDYRPPRK